MAVDYFHRLLVTGRPKDVRAFRRAIYREYPRTIAGETWTEIVPFSFAGLYELAPTARRVEAETPFDPYELSAWPVRNIGEHSAEVRYQLQTRNLELVTLLRPLARALPKLTFTLTTSCLDDSSIESYRLSGRREESWLLPDSRRDFHWDRARKKFKLAGDDVYDDDDSDHWAEQEMLTEAFGHWDEAGRIRRGRAPRYRWWNAIRLRDLDTERKLSLLAMGFVLEEESGANKERAPKRRATPRNPPRRTPGAASRRRSSQRRKRHS
jgi:hypothetical protein